MRRLEAALDAHNSQVLAYKKRAIWQRVEGPFDIPPGALSPPGVVVQHLPHTRVPATRRFSSFCMSAEERQFR
jgi:hypothetical protein